MGGKSGGSVTVGYHYYMNIHFALAHAGVQELLEIRIGDRPAWRGNLSGAGSAYVAQTQLFGGEDREGGVLGVADFMPGEPDQPINHALEAAIKKSTGIENIPSYRGVSTIFFHGFSAVDLSGTPWATGDSGTLPPDDSVIEVETREPVELTRGSGDSGDSDGRSFKETFTEVVQHLLSSVLMRSSFLWSGMNPYFKTPKFLVRRVWREWYPAKAQIGEDVNPAHIIYECLVNGEWGLGYPNQDVNDDSFSQAADTLHDEGLGLSLKWKSQSRVREFIELVLEHINGTLVEDRETGEFRLTLVRGGYDVENLFELNEDNCILENFQRKTLSDTVNEVLVAFTRPEDGETDTVAVQDLANFSNTGQINSQKKEYPGVRSSELAMRLALRDLNTLSKPVAKVTVTCDRSILGHYPGDVVKLNWPRLGLNGIALRIGSMNMGTPGDGKIQVEAVEDVFALPTGAYSTPQPIGWVDSARPPEPINDYRLFELSYYELQLTTSSGDRLDWPVDVGFVAAAVKESNSDTREVVLYDETTREATGAGTTTAVFTVTEDVVYSDGEIHIDMANAEVDALVQSGIAWLNDELIEIVAANIDDATISVNRGMIDTVPAKHLSGSQIFFYVGSDYVLDSTERVADEVVDYRLLPETSQGKLNVTNAPVVDYTLQNRQLRPYRPGNLQVNGTLLPEVILGDTNPIFTWSHRDRTQETTGEPTLFSEGDIGPEEGVTYTLEVINEDGVSQVVEADLTSTEYEYTTEIADLGKPISSPQGIFQILSSEGPIPTLGLITYWKMGQKPLVDQTGNHPISEVTDVKIVGNGVVGNAFEFSSDEDSIVHIPAKILPENDYALSFWINAYDLSASLQYLIMCGTSGETSGTNFNSWRIRNDGTLSHFGESGSGTDLVSDTSSSVVRQGQLDHFVIIVQGESFDVYRNAQFIETVAYQEPDGVPQESYIGVNGDNMSSHFDGILDQIRIYDLNQVTIDQQEITRLYNEREVTEDRRNTELRFRLKSVRDGLDSFQEHDLTFERAGYGYNYGNYYGGVV